MISKYDNNDTFLPIRYLVHFKHCTYPEDMDVNVFGIPLSGYGEIGLEITIVPGVLKRINKIITWKIVVVDPSEFGRISKISI